MIKLFSKFDVFIRVRSSITAQLGYGERDSDTRYYVLEEIIKKE